MPATEARRPATSCARWRRCASRCFSSSSPTPSMPAMQLQLDVELAVLARPHIGRDRLACGSSVSSPSGTHPVDERVREALGPPSRAVPSARLAVDDQREDAVLAPEPLEGQDLLVDPARLRRLRRADDDLEGGLLAARASASRRGSWRWRVRRGRGTPARSAPAPDRTRSRGRPGASARGRSRAPCAATSPTPRRSGCS